MVSHVDYIHRVIFVQLAQMLQDSDLLLRLAMEAFFVTHHLQGDVRIGFVVEGLDDLAEASLANHFEDFIAVAHVVVLYVNVGALVVVVATIVETSNQSGPLLGSEQIGRASCRERV